MTWSRHLSLLFIFDRTIGYMTGARKEMKLGFLPYQPFSLDLLLQQAYFIVTLYRVSQLMPHSSFYIIYKSSGPSHNFLCKNLIKVLKSLWTYLLSGAGVSLHLACLSCKWARVWVEFEVFFCNLPMVKCDSVGLRIMDLDSRTQCQTGNWDHPNL